MHAHTSRRKRLSLCTWLGKFAFAPVTLFVDVQARECVVHAWPRRVCACVCVFSGPLPTITVSVHYSLGPAEIIINREQRRTGGNERMEERFCPAR